MKYTVSISVDGRIDIEVDADSTEEARTKALEAFSTTDLSKMEIVGRDAVNCSDEEGNIIEEYD